MNEPELTQSEIKANLQFQVCEAAGHLNSLLSGLGAQMWLVGKAAGDQYFNRMMRLFGNLWQIAQRNKTLSIALQDLEDFNEQKAE